MNISAELNQSNHDSTETPGIVPALNALALPRALIVQITIVLAFIWLLLGLWFGLIPVGPHLTNRLGGVAAGDFMFFYATGVLSARGEAPKVHDPKALTAAARETLGPKVPELVWPYPPTLSLPLSLLGRLPPRAALLLWLCVSTSALMVMGRLAFGRWRLAPLVLLCPASALVLFTGQLTSVLALLFAVVFLMAERSPRLGGVAIGLLAWKPHFVVLPALITFFRGRKATLAAIGTLVALTATSLLAFGLEAWSAFLFGGMRHAGVLNAEAPMGRFVTIFGTASTFGATGEQALIIHAFLATAGSSAGLWLWKNATLGSVRSLGLAGALLQLTPYALDYDLVFLVLPWALMIQEVRRTPQLAPVHFWPWIVLTCLVPCSYLISLYTGRSVTGPVLLVLLVATWASVRRKGRVVDPVVLGTPQIA